MSWFEATRDWTRSEAGNSMCRATPVIELARAFVNVLKRGSQRLLPDERALKRAGVMQWR